MVYFFGHLTQTSTARHHLPGHYVSPRYSDLLTVTTICHPRTTHQILTGRSRCRESPIHFAPLAPNYHEPERRLRRQADRQASMTPRRVPEQPTPASTPRAKQPPTPAPTPFLPVMITPTQPITNQFPSFRFGTPPRSAQPSGPHVPPAQPHRHTTADPTVRHFQCRRLLKHTNMNHTMAHGSTNPMTTCFSVTKRSSLNERNSNNILTQAPQTSTNIMTFWGPHHLLHEAQSIGAPSIPITWGPT